MFEAVRRKVERSAEQSCGSFWGEDSLHFRAEAPAPEGDARRGATEESRSRPSRGVCLRERPIRLDHGPDLFNHTAYTVLIDFCKEREDDRGHLVCFDGSFGLFAGEKTLEATVTTDMGEREMTSGNVDLGTGKWHRLGLTFSGRAGRADLYLNGSRICAARGLEGARQAGNFFADLYIGCAAGGSFTGRIDNFRFLDRALGPEDLPPL